MEAFMNDIKQTIAKSMLLLLAILLLTAVILSCKIRNTDGEEMDDKKMRSLGTFEGLSAETEKQILQTVAEYTEWRWYHFVITEYFGTYNGAVTVIWDYNPEYFGRAGVVEPSWREFPAGIEFVYNGWSKGIQAWKDGILYSLSEAYDISILTREDIENIHNLYTIYLIENPFSDIENEVFIGGKE